MSAKVSPEQRKKSDASGVFGLCQAQSSGIQYAIGGQLMRKLLHDLVGNIRNWRVLASQPANIPPFSMGRNRLADLATADRAGPSPDHAAASFKGDCRKRSSI